MRFTTLAVLVSAVAATYLPFMDLNSVDNSSQVLIRSLDIEFASASDYNLDRITIVGETTGEVLDYEEKNNTYTSLFIRLCSSSQNTVLYFDRLCKALQNSSCPIPAGASFTIELEGLIGAVPVCQTKVLDIAISSDDGSLAHVVATISKPLGATASWVVGLAIPLSMMLFSCIKYLIIKLVDPDPLTSWEPTANVLKSGKANELAYLSGYTQVLSSLQFMVLSSLVNVHTPLFFTHIVSRFSWVIGLVPSNLVSNLAGGVNLAYTAGLLVSVGRNNLEKVVYLSSMSTVADIWPAVILFLLCCSAFAFFAAAITHFRYPLLYILAYGAGMILRVFYISFPTAFLLWTFYTLNTIVVPHTRGPRPHPHRDDMQFRSSLATWRDDAPNYLIRDSPQPSLVSAAYRRNIQPLNDMSPPAPVPPQTNQSFHVYHQFFTTRLPKVAEAFLVIALICYFLGLIAIGWNMRKAQKRGFLRKYEVIVWGRVFEWCGKWGIAFNVSHYGSIIILCLIIAVWPNEGVVQCVLFLVFQLLSITFAALGQPLQLSQWGYIVYLIPQVLQAVVLCLLLPLLNWNSLGNNRNWIADRLAYTILIIFVFILAFHFIVCVSCVWCSVQRRLASRRANYGSLSQKNEWRSSLTMPMTNLEYNRENRGAPVMFWDEPARSTSNVVEDDEETLNPQRNYAVREVDFLYGYNQYSLDSQKTRRPTPAASSEQPSKKPNAIITTMNHIMRKSDIKPPERSFQVLRGSSKTPLMHDSTFPDRSFQVLGRPDRRTSKHEDGSERSFQVLGRPGKGPQKRDDSLSE